jgi:hypothetical protein
MNRVMTETTLVVVFIALAVMFVLWAGEEAQDRWCGASLCQKVQYVPTTEQWSAVGR